MAYALENALFQWREGERRIAATAEPARARLDEAATAVVAELRKRLGSSFTVDELAELYGTGTDWATDLADRRGASTEAATVVDAAFGRYAREASDFAGGRPLQRHERG
jgi:hypothetical protein